MMPVNLYFLAAVNDVFVFHVLDDFRFCGKRVEKISNSH